MSQKYSPVLRRCITHIQIQDEINILRKVMKGRRQQVRHRPRDPVVSKVFVGWDQDSSANKNSIQSNIKSGQFQHEKSHYRQKQLTDNRDNNPLHSKSVELPYLFKNKTESDLKKQHLQQNRRASELQLSKRKKQQISSLKKILEVDEDIEKVRNKLSKLVKKVFDTRGYSKQSDNSLQTPRRKNNKSMRQNHNKKIKLQIMRKNIKKPQKYPKQWCQINILKLRTYFVKLQTNQVANPKLLAPNQIQLYDKVYVPKKQKIPDFIREYKPLNKQIHLQNLIKDPKFQIVIDEDSLYFGCVQDDKRCGKGVYVCKNYRFQGVWINDCRNYGFQITNQGYYKGNFKNDVRHGQGQYSWKNGQKYEGEWRNGVKHGSGIWKSGKGDSYLGQWVNGKVQGYGVHISLNGQRFEGNFINFLKNGKGIQTFPNGDKFQGQYKNGKPNGIGKYTWKNLIYYEGQFVEGYRHGKGTIVAQKYMKFEGNFLGQKVYGKGQITYQNGDKFIGQFKQGQRQGQGTLKLKTQHKVISGIWHNDEYINQAQNEQGTQNSYD